MKVRARAVTPPRAGGHRRRPPRAMALVTAGVALLGLASVQGASASRTAVAATTLGCAASPHTCGFPDATNSGVPAGTVLRAVPGQLRSGPGWTWDDNDGVVVTGTGATLNGLDIAGGVEIKAAGVTLSNSRVTESGDWWGIGLYHTTNATITHCKIWSRTATGPDRLGVAIKDVAGDAVGTKVVANNIAHASTGVQTHEGLVKDNYIHDMGYWSGGHDHINGITSNGASTPMLITHNTVFNNYGQTDAIGLFEDFGVEANRTITNNLLAGGGYTVYGGQNPGNSPRAFNIVITGNRFARKFYSGGGGYGPVAAFSARGAGAQWSNNIWDDTGATVSAS